MDMACRLYHGKRADAPPAVEVMAFPHLEMMATEEADRRKLKILADELAAFGGIPFSYKEMELTDGTRHGAHLRIALGERPA